MRSPRSTTAPTSSPTRGSMVAIGLLSLLLSVLAGGTSAAQGSFSAQATADTQKVTVINAGTPVTDTPFDGGGFTAQAVTDNLGSTIGFATGPNPGSLALSVPGLAGGFGSPVPVPPYPFFVQADASNPEAQSEQGPYVLRATVDGQNAAGSATVSPSGSEDARLGEAAATAEATVGPDGTVTATARSESSGFAVGPLIIGSAVSTATVTKPPEGEAQATSDLEITGMSIAGQAVGYSGGQFTLLGVPLGGGEIQPLLDQLAAGGITIEVIDAEPTATGVISGGVRITLQETTITPAVTPSADSSTIVIDMGRAYAAADGVPGPVIQAPPPPATVAAGQGPAPGGQSGGAGTAPATSSSSTTTTSSGPSRPAASSPAGSPASRPAEPEPAGPAGPAVAAPAPAPAQTAPTATVIPDEVEANPFYLVLVVAGLASFGGLGALRVVGPKEA